jgi:outer membrane protein
MTSSFSYRTSLAALASAGACLLAPGMACARDWIVTVGGRAQAVVPYEGAGYDIFVPIPSFHLRRADRPERPVLPDDALGLALVNLGPVSFGPNVRVRGKRRDEDERTGLREVKLAIEPGMYVTAWPTNWLRAHAEARRGVRGHHGWLGDVAADLVLRSGAWTATVGPRAGWGDQNYMDTYFGVTPAEAAANTLIDASYRPKGGLRYVGAQATLVRRFGPWQATANVGYHHLGDIAAASQIVQRIGSRQEFNGGVGLRYSFDWSH